MRLDFSIYNKFSNSLFSVLSGLLSALFCILLLSSCRGTKTIRDEAEKKLLLKSTNLKQDREDYQEAYTLLRQKKYAAYPKVSALLKNIIKHSPDNTSAAYLLGILKLREKEYNEAVAAFKKVIEKKPAHLEAITGLGNAYLNLGERAKARKHYQRALFLAPENPKVLNNLAVFYFQQKDYKQAVFYLKKSLTPCPEKNKSNCLNNQAQLYFNLANVYYQMNKFREAEEAYKKSLSLNPENVTAKNNLALLLFEQGEVKEAQELLETSRKRFLFQDDRVYSNLGFIQRRTGKINAAEKSYLRALEINQSSLPALKNLGILYDIYLGKKELAILYYQRYVELEGPDKDTVKKWIRALERQ